MKLLTTSSADIVQECCVMFDAKSVSKSIFKCRLNVLPVVVFKYTVSQKKQDTKLLAISSPIIIRFSKSPHLMIGH